MPPFEHFEVQNEQQPESSGLVDRLLQRLSGSATYSQIGTSDWQADRTSQDRWSPEEAAGWWSTLTYSYASGLIKLGYEQPLHQEHLWDMARKNEAVPVADQFQAALLKTKDSINAPHVSFHTSHCIKTSVWHVHSFLHAPVHFT